MDALIEVVNTLFVMAFATACLVALAVSIIFVVSPFMKDDPTEKPEEGKDG